MIRKFFAIIHCLLTYNLCSDGVGVYSKKHINKNKSKEIDEPLFYSVIEVEEEAEFI